MGRWRWELQFRQWKVGSTILPCGSGGGSTCPPMLYQGLRREGEGAFYHAAHYMFPSAKQYCCFLALKFAYNTSISRKGQTVICSDIVYINGSSVCGSGSLVVYRLHHK